MNNYKTFQHCFIALIKFIAIMLFITWLISCNSKQQTIGLIRAYKDSIGMAQEQIHMLDYKVDMITRKYVDSFPAKAFTTNQVIERATFKQNESIAYHKMINDREYMQNKISPKKLYLQIRIVCFKSILDSLKRDLNE